MKAGKARAFVFLAGMLMVSGTAFAADVTTAVDVNSAYVWRGITFNDEVVVQPSLDVTSGGFGLNVWGNLDVGDYNNTLDSGKFSEVDLTARYSLQAGPICLTGGYIEYLFPTTDSGGAEATREFFLDASVKPLDGVTTGLASYYDVGQIHSYYLNPYVGYGMDIGSGVHMNLRAAAGYAGKDFVTAYGGQQSGFFDYNLSLALGYSIAKNVSVTGRLGYADSINRNVLPEQDVNFYGGVGAAVTF